MILSRLFARRYDVFVSYRSQDVRIARTVADQLIATGKKVWFAEYQILLKQYERFQEAIDEGIRNSTYGLAITNDSYAGSVHCQREMNQLLEQCGSARVLEVQVPAEPEPHRVFPMLASSPSHAGNTINDILAFISSQTGWNLPGIDASTSSDGFVEAVAMDWRYRLETHGWTVRKPGTQSLADWGSSEWRMPLGENVLRQSIQIGRVPISLDGPELGWDGPGPPLFVNLHTGPELSGHAARSTGDADDREMYRELMTYIPRHLRKLRFSRLRGLHLLFHGGTSQFAVTYRWGGYWTRKCSVILRHPKSRIATEFVFTFGLKGSFEDYCRRACVMDALVSTLAWCLEGRFVSYYFDDSKRGVRDITTLRVAGLHATREQADLQSKQHPLGFTSSEPAFLSKYGEKGREKLPVTVPRSGGGRQ